jgi:hypothetical protein
MERLLTLFIENDVQRRLPLSSAITLETAVSLHGALKKLCLRHQMLSLSWAVIGCLRGLDSRRAEGYTFSYGEGNEDHRRGTG